MALRYFQWVIQCEVMYSVCGCWGGEGGWWEFGRSEAGNDDHPGCAAVAPGTGPNCLDEGFDASELDEGVDAS